MLYSLDVMVRMIRRRLKAQKKYQYELAELLGISVATMSYKARYPEKLSLAELRKIFAVLKFTDEDILLVMGREGEMGMEECPAK